MRTESFKKRVRKLERRIIPFFIRVFFGEKPGPVMPALMGSAGDLEIRFDAEDEGLL